MKRNFEQLAEDVAAQSKLPADQLGKLSAALREVATTFENVGEKEEAKQLNDYASGFNRAAGKQGKNAV
jgi:methyl-accepting chemotaxis protein